MLMSLGRVLQERQIFSWGFKGEAVIECHSTAKYSREGIVANSLSIIGCVSASLMDVPVGH